MSNTLQDWVVGFEEELNRRFEKKISLIVVENPSEKKMLLITEIVAEFSGVSVGEMLGKSRGLVHVSDARMVAMYFIKLHTDAPKRAIGKLFGNRDHSTVIHAIETVKTRIATEDARAFSLIKKVAQCIAQKM